ncbi:hypothetical protein RUM43_005126 [Polyplax serrata]|uniref:Diacylglycerol O-acyltransferase n=1 Tax=Polyplax serrata TaxID=468196 RepID=A0AAN8XPD0_POLSC
MSCDYLRSAPIRRLPHPMEENPVWGIIGSIISSIIAVAISLPFLLVFLLVLPVYLSVKWLLLFIYCNRHGTNSAGPESVCGNDSRWLGTEWRSSVIHAVLVFEAKEGVNVDHFRRLLLKRVIPLYPRLTQRLIFLPLLAGVGNCWMTDAKFSIDQHVFTGPSFLSNEKDLQEYVSKLVADGLPEDKSPWQLQVFQSFGTNRDTVIILRVHQSVADGTALMRLLCHSLADAQIIEVPERPRSGSLAFCVDVFRACILGPLTLLLWIFCSEEDCNLLTHRSSWTGSVTVTWSASITLPKVVVPMDLRDSSATVRTTLGNKTSSVIMPLPVAVEGCVPRLWATRKTLDSLKTSVDPIILHVTTAALMSIGSTSFARHLVNYFTDRASLQFSSIPGPTSEVLLEGQSLKGIYPILPAQANLGISITTMTYADQVFVSVIAERALGPAAELILQYLEDQIEVLWNLLLNRRVPGVQESPTLYVKANMLESQGGESDSKFNLVQKDGDHYNELEEADKCLKVDAIKAEFSELVNELKRQSMVEVKKETEFKNSQVCLSPCSVSKTENIKGGKHFQKLTIGSDQGGKIITTLNDPTRLVANEQSQSLKRSQDCVIDVSDNGNSSLFNRELLSLTRKHKNDTEQECEERSDWDNRKDGTPTNSETKFSHSRKPGNFPDICGESSSKTVGPNELNYNFQDEKYLESYWEQSSFGIFEIKSDDRLEDSDESEIVGGVLI